jgi:multidrug efflux pump
MSARKPIAPWPGRLPRKVPTTPKPPTKLPLSVVLIVPMCLLASVTGLGLRGLPIDILAQIGFVVLVGLAAKNAILIVEFARQAQDAGSTPAAAAVSAARRRLRPILMTSLAFILGVAPLVVATGAGAEMRQSLGTAVFAGMLGVTGFGLIFTPAFYTLMQRIGIARGRAPGTRHEPGDPNREGKGAAVAAIQLQPGQ